MTRLASLAFASLVAAACAKDPTAGKTQAAVGTAKPETPLASAGELIEVTPAVAKIGFIGAKVTAQHVGKFSDFHGAIALSDGRPEASRVEVEVKTASVSIEGGPAKLENHLRSPDFFDVANHPTARFVSTAIQPGSDVAGATHTVTGNLTLRGTTRSVTFPATITVTPAEVGVKAEFGINRKDFGIVYPGMADDLIKDNVLLHIEITAPRTQQRS